MVGLNDKDNKTPEQQDAIDARLADDGAKEQDAKVDAASNPRTNLKEEQIEGAAPTSEEVRRDDNLTAPESGNVKASRDGGKLGSLHDRVAYIERYLGFGK